jgi:tRNA(Ile)-lysidine synthase
LQQLPKLKTETLELLRTSKNLLAYSAGSDSNALFFILKALHVEFDIALVNYKTREQSDEEASYAQELAKKFNKQCFSLTCRLEKHNFEHNARKARYEFFEKIIKQNSYDNLITAHHLNDKFEWFLMQLGKGAGLVELLGFEEITQNENYVTVRPLIYTSKKQINDFLQENKIKYFLDNTNTNEKYMRNHIRASYANDFIKEYKDGLVKSFEYLNADSKLLEAKILLHVKDLFILHGSKEDIIDIRGIDKILKQLGYLLSNAQRQEILQTKNCVIGNQFSIGFNEQYIFIAPFLQVTMPKEFKEECRKYNIPTKIRPYLFKNALKPSAFHTLL